MDFAEENPDPAEFDLRASLAELHAATEPGEFQARIQRLNDGYRAQQEARARGLDLAEQAE
ncbi:hypothetical protein [Amycolatopsis anabasis]|uniref:hypothetical protein n=1 Tax=Amycolatopsis anabasis TaxID=1840409 RepID=UPI00131D2DD6|nr:hypothetical protein [Amycolatopsis anabasis]